MPHGPSLDSTAGRFRKGSSPEGQRSKRGLGTFGTLLTEDLLVLGRQVRRRRQLVLGGGGLVGRRRFLLLVDAATLQLADVVGDLGVLGHDRAEGLIELLGGLA